jgi:ribosome-associated protein
VRAGRLVCHWPRALKCLISMQELEFELAEDFIELHKLLKVVGASESGGAAKMLVAEGAVQVDGHVELRKACKIRAGQVVRAGDLRIQVRAA